ncbi:histidine--tRNA ligase [Fulvivirgaceae bacterium BMA12]|uniref:Histidine--tRNA ligase n=1 Tax=Agaribacillus aureus TaxID=3051825 RepID=A0ABT8L9A1_9BACT|nr:histidine--tRNA ligase [Fulvivirgaceae bacterium BMA12]
MSMQKPGLPKGMRDFGPDKMAKRNFIFSAIRTTFEKFGYQPLETPSMENLSVLTGKYGDEGDQLLFKVLNSGDYLAKTSQDDYDAGSKQLLHKISEKGLKYDLTVPFARYVVMNRHELTFPFKRYQIQPVWRADRPQKGRYREFYQCDADVIGTNSLICEMEIVLMINEVFDKLGIENYDIKVNNRKILAGITEAIGEADKLSELCTSIDKLDKIGKQGVIDELGSRSFASAAINALEPFLNIEGDNDQKLKTIKTLLADAASGLEGISEFEEILNYLAQFGIKNHHIAFDPMLARGLSYYTGTILEVKSNDVKIGSLSGGGRYDDLTGVFGMPGISGIGFSFGVDRIYDVMDTLGLFPEEAIISTTALVTNFERKTEPYALKVLSELRNAQIKSEIYPEPAKLKKQMNYADKKNIPYVLLVGEDEMESQLVTLKNMQTGQQTKITISEGIEILAKH